MSGSGGSGADLPQALLARNRRWAAAQTEQQGDFFSRLCGRQTPTILWLGCADSRVPPEQILNLPPGEVFVHRNIANTLPRDDLSSGAVLHYALNVLRVAHVIVCGHYGCGGVAAAMEDAPNDASSVDSEDSRDSADRALNDWLQPLRALRRAHADVLANIPARQRADKLCELNVIAQLQNVAAGSAMRAARQNGHAPALHGWIYNMQNGLLKNLQPADTAAE